MSKEIQYTVYSHEISTTDTNRRWFRELQLLSLECTMEVAIVLAV